MNKLRRRIFEKLAQAAPPDNLPTTEVTQTQTVSGSPPVFIATDYYPSMVIGLTSKNATIINGLTNLLNQALFYTSGGNVHLQWMKSVNFNFGTTDIPSVDLKNLMGLAKQIYNQLYMNQGEPYSKQLTPQEIAKKLAPLKSSNFISNLSSTSPMGQLSSKIGGNVKTLINNYLLQIQ